MASSRKKKISASIAALLDSPADICGHEFLSSELLRLAFGYPGLSFPEVRKGIQGNGTRPFLIGKHLPIVPTWLSVAVAEIFAVLLATPNFQCACAPRKFKKRSN